jgi:hypothetical protein
MEIPIRPDRMTVCADDVAFRYLRVQERPRLEERLAGRERKALLSWVAMVKIHDPRGKALAAIGARPAPEIPE